MSRRHSSPPVTIDYHAIARDPAWFAHRYDSAADAIHLVRLTRADHAGATFVTDEHLPPDRPRLALDRAALMDVLPRPARLHLILHSAFCCSTMVARALDLPGIATAVKEPPLLNDLVGCRRRGLDSRSLTRLTGDALTLLARPFEAGEVVVIKPSNIVNAFAPAMMALREDSHALVLHAPLRVFMASVARKGMWGRLWARELFVSLLADGLVAGLGFASADHLRHTDLQIAAIGWLAQQAFFARLHDRYGAARVRSIDSEALLAQPEMAMAGLAGLFALKIDVANIVAGPAFATNSKNGSEFGAEDRARAHRDGSMLHADEIEKVAIWAEAVARSAGVALTLPAPLLD